MVLLNLEPFRCHPMDDRDAFAGKLSESPANVRSSCLSRSPRRRASIEITEMPPCALCEIGCVTTSTLGNPLRRCSIEYFRPEFFDFCSSSLNFASTYRRKTTPMPFNARKIDVAIKPPSGASLLPSVSGIALLMACLKRGRHPMPLLLLRCHTGCAPCHNPR